MATQNRYYSSTTKRTTLTADPGTSGATLTVVDSTVFASLDGKYPYALVINTDSTDREVVYVTNRPTSTTLTVARGRDGTTGQAHAIGSTVDHMLIAADLNELSAHMAADWLFVRDFGAKGDGTTDDRAALQSAIDTAAATGATVFFSPGTYLIGDALVLKTGVTLRGSHGSAWPFRFPASSCVIKCSSSFGGECAISMLGADITGSGSNEGATRIFDLDLSGESLPAGSVSGIHAQGEVMDVVLARMTIKQFSHNGIHTNVGTGSKAPHDWFMDSVVAYNNASFGFSMSMTDGYIRDCIASTNGLDGWLLGPLGSLTMTGCQALFNTQHGFNVAGGTQVGNVTMLGPLTDRNGRDGIHLGSSSGSGSPPIVLTGAVLNRDGRNGGTGGGSYAGLRIDGCANPVIVNGITVDTGVDDDGSGTNSPQYGASLTGSNAYVQISGGYLHGDTAGLNDDGTTTVLRRFNVDEATGPRSTPTFAYGNGVAVSGLGLALPNAATVPATPTTGAIIYGGTSRAVVKNASGLNGTIPLSALAKTSTTTLSNSTTETVLHTFTIAGSDASVGSVYSIRATGTMDWTTGSPTVTFRVRLGGVSGATIASCTVACTSSASTSGPAWNVEGDIVCITTGSSGTWRGSIKALAGIQSGGFGAAANPATAGAPSSAVTQTTTSTNDLVITAQWSAASASNTIRCDTGYASRIR